MTGYVPLIVTMERKQKHKGNKTNTTGKAKYLEIKTFPRSLASCRFPSPELCRGPKALLAPALATVTMPCAVTTWSQVRAKLSSLIAMTGTTLLCQEPQKRAK